MYWFAVTLVHRHDDFISTDNSGDMQQENYLHLLMCSCEKSVRNENRVLLLLCMEGHFYQLKWKKTFKFNDSKHFSKKLIFWKTTLFENILHLQKERFFGNNTLYDKERFLRKDLILFFKKSRSMFWKKNIHWKKQTDWWSYLTYSQRSEYCKWSLFILELRFLHIVTLK